MTQQLQNTLCNIDQHALYKNLKSILLQNPNSLSANMSPYAGNSTPVLWESKWKQQCTERLYEINPRLCVFGCKEHKQFQDDMRSTLKLASLHVCKDSEIRAREMAE